MDDAMVIALIAQLKLATEQTARVADALEHIADLYAQVHFPSDDHSAEELGPEEHF